MRTSSEFLGVVMQSWFAILNLDRKFDNAFAVRGGTTGNLLVTGKTSPYPGVQNLLCPASVRPSMSVRGEVTCKKNGWKR